MTDLVIIADDLTGAADAAALMSRRGSTAVVIDPEGDWPAADVLAVDTDSRHCEPRPAAARVTAATRRAHRLGARVVKKVDSTLRGNIAAELLALAGVLDELDGHGGHGLVVLAPAFPGTSRTTVGGVVHVGGRRLDAHGSDGDVVALLRRGGLRTGHVGLEALTDGASLARAYDAAAAADLDAVVVDSETDAQLETVVAAAEAATSRIVLAGSGGLTRPLAHGAASSSPPSRASSSPSSPRGGGPGGETLVVVGSYAPAARDQLTRLVDEGLHHVVLGGDPAANAADVRDALHAGPTVLSPDPAAPVLRERAPEVARALAEATSAALDRAGTLVATGGETARAVLVAAGVGRMLVVEEVEPGVVRCRVPELDLDVVTKAGAFGDRDALLRCLPGQRPRTVTERKNSR